MNIGLEKLLLKSVSWFSRNRSPTVAQKWGKNNKPKHFKSHTMYHCNMINKHMYYVTMNMHIYILYTLLFTDRNI